MQEAYIGIARRENNTKRNYLVVNKLQGKHVPTSPGKALALFKVLGERMREAYKDEKLLVVGFAETATAIGAQLAIILESDYIQTTREVIEGVSYLYFSEEHSHATEQKLVKEDLDYAIDKIERILFVEDEVTTGNTILNIISVLEKTYAKKINYTVASLINGMNEQSRMKYIDKGIDVYYSLKTAHDTFSEIAKTYKGDGTYQRLLDSKADCLENKRAAIEEVQVIEIAYKNTINPRRLTESKAYDKACKELWEQVEATLMLRKRERVLVLGTEELMYPALYIGKMLEEKGQDVKCHATTRSPIEVSQEQAYPLHTRYELISLYDDERKVYIYDLEKYDKVIIVTDAPEHNYKGIESLISALKSCGNTRFYQVRWE